MQYRNWRRRRRWWRWCHLYHVLVIKSIAAVMLCLLAFAAQAQPPTVQLGMTQPVPGTLQFNLLPAGPFSGWLAGTVVTVRWQTTLGLSLGTVPTMHLSPTQVYFNSLTTDGGYTYLTFYSVDFGPQAVPWVGGVSIPFFSVPINNTGGACVDLELVIDQWQVEENIRWYISLDGYVSNNFGAPFVAGQTTVPACPPVVLPVTLLWFTAKEEDGVNVLQWATGSEVNSDYFRVDRSTDLVQWQAVGKVPSGAMLYSLTDRGHKEGTNYYRLVQVDMDGTAEVLGIEAVTNKVPGRARMHYNLLGQCAQ